MNNEERRKALQATMARLEAENDYEFGRIIHPMKKDKTEGRFVVYDFEANYRKDVLTNSSFAQIILWGQHTNHSLSLDDIASDLTAMAGKAGMTHISALAYRTDSIITVTLRGALPIHANYSRFQKKLGIA